MMNLSVKFKILSLVVLFTALVIALNINSAYSSKNTATELKELSTQSLELMKHLEKSRQLLLQQSVEFERGYFQVSIAKSLGGYGTEQIVASSEEFKKYTQELESSIIQVTDILQRMPASQGLDELLGEIENLKADQIRFLEASDTTYQWWIKLKTLQANKARKLAQSSLDAVNHDMENIITLIDSYVENANKEQTNNLNKNLITSAVIAAIAVIFGIIVSLLITNHIVSALKKVVRRAELIAQGDLSQSLQATNHTKKFEKNEISQLEVTIDKLSLQLSNIIHDVSSSSQKLTQAANNLSDETRNSSQMVDEQQRETTQISHSVDEIRATAIHISESTSNASTAAHEAEIAAEQGHTIVKHTIDNIENLASEIDSASKTINQLDTDTSDISEILNVILNIAEQTNLLALNAAIEAARAGEQGRGFAVVADEVRQLAQNTQGATQQIEAMITKLQSGANHAVKVMQTSHTISNNVVEAVKEEESSLREINQSVSKIRQMNDSISATAEEQSTVTSEVNNNVINIANIAEKSVASIHSIDNSATVVADLANQLSSKIAYFKVQ